MTRAKALEKYFSHNPLAAKMIERLCRWDEDATLSENRDNVGYPVVQNAYQLARSYHLGYRNVVKVAGDKIRVWEKE
jgi:hypothetical protein